DPGVPFCDRTDIPNAIGIPGSSLRQPDRPSGPAIEPSRCRRGLYWHERRADIRSQAGREAKVPAIARAIRSRPIRRPPGGVGRADQAALPSPAQEAAQPGPSPKPSSRTRGESVELQARVWPAGSRKPGQRVTIEDAAISGNHAWTADQDLFAA